MEAEEEEDDDPLVKPGDRRQKVRQFRSGERERVGIGIWGKWLKSLLVVVAVAEPSMQSAACSNKTSYIGQLDYDA